MKNMRASAIILLINAILLSLLGNLSANWKTISTMPTPRYGITSAVLDSEIYIIGGIQYDYEHNSDISSDVVEKYDPRTNSWTLTVAPLQKKLYNAVAVAFAGKIYLFGGREGDELAEKIEVYDPVTNHWTEIEQEMPLAREGAAAVIAGNEIFLIGGYSKNGSYLDRIDIFNPATNSWRIAPTRLNSARASLAAVAVADTIFALGGFFFSPLRSVEKSTTADANWQTMPDMNAARASFAACALKNCFYAIGGQGNSKILKSTEKFDLATQTWTYEDDLINRRKQFTAQPFGGKIYVFGGSNDSEKYIAEVEEFTPSGSSVMPTNEMQPVDFKIFQNYPNPFNSQTSINYQLSGTKYFRSQSIVKLSIFNILGEEVARLIDGYQSPGSHKIIWNGTNKSGRELPTGYYLGILQVHGQSETIKIHLLK